uniref:LAM_G_DOMAIN domain-containing protein n=1 Tax=Angiostrongylus cantonensis TaxID=6313 RepID=A0A0K0DK20_ANGCA
MKSFSVVGKHGERSCPSQPSDYGFLTEWATHVLLAFNQGPAVWLAIDSRSGFLCVKELSGVLKNFKISDVQWKNMGL